MPVEPYRITDESSPGKIPVKPKSRRLTMALNVCGLILISGTLFYINFWLYHPIGHGPAGPTVAREPFEQTWTARPVVLLGFGDSIAAGFGASSGHSFFQMLVSNPADDWEEMRGLSLSSVIPNLEANNVALSGSTSLEHETILLDKIPEYDADTFGIVVATIGGNDVIHMYGRTPPREGAMYGATLEQAKPWIENYEQRLNAILDRIEEKFPGGSHIFLFNIYDPTDGIGDTFNAGLPAWSEGLQVLKAYNDVISKTCETRHDTTLIDIRSEFMGHGIHSRQFWRSFYHNEDKGYWYYDNLEDPNDRGYDAIRRLCLIEMSRVLPARLSEHREVESKLE